MGNLHVYWSRVLLKGRFSQMAGEEVHAILGQYIASVIKNADAWTV